jgi:hypothetical protein
LEQVSEKIIALDEEARCLRLREAELEARGEGWAKERGGLLAAQDELRGELREKLALLDEFEERFARQYKWAARPAGPACLAGLARPCHALHSGAICPGAAPKRHGLPDQLLHTGF